MALAKAHRDYLRFEAMRAPRRAALATALGGGVAVLGAHALVLRLPASMWRFMEQAFRVEGMASILLVNDLLAAYFVTFFLGLGGLLDATVTAREEGRLEILLAKPVRARLLVAARAVPILVTATAAGIVVAIAIAVTVPRYLSPGDAISAGGTLGAALFLVALGALALSALLPVLVVLRDRLLALLLAALVWLAPVLPTGFFIYRPDLFGDGAASFTVLPALLWHDGVAAWLGPVALGAALPFGAAMVVLAGRILERSDAR